MLNRVTSWLRDSRGYAAVELGLVAACMTLAAIGGITSFEHKLGGTAADMRGELR